MACSVSGRVVAGNGGVVGDEGEGPCDTVGAADGEVLGEVDGLAVTDVLLLLQALSRAEVTSRATHVLFTAEGYGCWWVEGNHQDRTYAVSC